MKILIEKNSLNKAGQHINEVLPVAKHKKTFVITDKKILDFEFSIFNSLRENGYWVETIIVPAGEDAKSFENYEKAAEEILSRGLTRRDFLIALGGGAIGDLTGFLASTLLRGVPYVQIPTTLLAQVDSSVGGKTAINTKAGKNLIGTFYQPIITIIDPETLLTLPSRDLKSGYTEALKYALINDKDFFEYLEEHGEKALKYDLDALEYIIKKSCQHKAEIVEQDEFETKDIRVLLNLGHTFGHVYEKAANYDSSIILHGEAVGLGIVQAFKLSEELGMCSYADTKKVINHFKKLKLFDFNDYGKLNISKITTPDYMLENMKKDKKSNHDKLNFVLVKGIGEAVFVKDVDKNIVKKIIKK